MPLLKFNERGIYCEQGDFYIDPLVPVDSAVITHAHSDHARWGMKKYLAHEISVPVMAHRLGDINAQGVGYNETVNMNGVKVSLHPAGHIPGSSQVRVEYKGEVWVVSGDYKTQDDGFCAPFEPVNCHHFITESTFALPVFNWNCQRETMNELDLWWEQNCLEGVNSVVFCYALGKAQRILQSLPNDRGPIFVHGAIANTNEVLAPFVELRPWTYLNDEVEKSDLKGALILAPPSANGTSWMNRLKPFRTAIASGWMTLRGAKRRRNADRGLVLSDHADWNGLNEAIAATGAENIYVTHGYQNIFSRWLNEQGYNAQEVKLSYGENEEEE